MSGNTTRWWWIRHAPVTCHGGKLYGQTDLPANTDDDASFAALARSLPEGAVWVASNLQRTHQTAAAIGDAGHPLPEILVEPDLAEQHFGEWQGLTYAELGGAKHEAYHKFWVAPAHHTPPGGESFKDVMGRVGPVVDRLTAEHAGRDIVAVAHGGTIRAALALALGMAPEGALAFSVHNLSITRVDHQPGEGQGGNWAVVTVNGLASMDR